MRTNRIASYKLPKIQSPLKRKFMPTKPFTFNNAGAFTTIETTTFSNRIVITLQGTMGPEYAFEVKPREGFVQTRKSATGRFTFNLAHTDAGLYKITLKSGLTPIKALIAW